MMLKALFRRETMPNELLSLLPDVLDGGHLSPGKRSSSSLPVSPGRLRRQQQQQSNESNSEDFLQNILEHLEKTVNATASAQYWMNRGGAGGVRLGQEPEEEIMLLLAEKERQLELAAKVGQSLLEKNRELEHKNDFLEENLAKTNDQMTQLRHDLQQRSDLLRVFSNLDDDSLPRDSSDESLKRRLETSRQENDRLQQKCDTLRKNAELTVAEEKRRAQVLEKQLDDANDKVHRLQKQIEHKSQELTCQSATVEGLLKELAKKDNKSRELSLEKEEISEMLHEMMSQHDEKQRDLWEMQEQYTSLKSQLNEAEEELQRSRQRDAMRASSFDSLYDSLASEIENSDSGVCSSRGASAAPILGATTSTTAPGKPYHGASSMPLHRTIQPLSLELELAESTSTFQVETPLAPRQLVPQLCDASTSCTDIRECEPGPPLATSTPMVVKQEVVLQMTEPETVILQETPKRKVPTAALVLNRSPKKTLAATLYQAMVPAFARRTSSQDSLEDYEAPKMGQPGVPGTRDLDFSVKMIKTREELVETKKTKKTKKNQENEEVEEEDSMLFECATSSSSSFSVVKAPPPSSFGSALLFGRFPSEFLSRNSSSTAHEAAKASRNSLKSGAGRKSSEGWTDFGAAYGMRLIQGLCTESSSVDGIAQMAAGRSAGVLTRAEMTGPLQLSPQHRQPHGLCLSLSMTSSGGPMSATGVVQRRS